MPSSISEGSILVDVDNFVTSNRMSLVVLVELPLHVRGNAALLLLQLHVPRLLQCSVPRHGVAYTECCSDWIIIVVIIVTIAAIAAQHSQGCADRIHVLTVF